MDFTKRRQIFFTAHIFTQMSNFIILLCQLWFYYAKLLDTPEEDRQVLGFKNPVADSDGEKDNIFEPGTSFSGAFSTFVNQKN